MDGATFDVFGDAAIDETGDAKVEGIGDTMVEAIDDNGVDAIGDNGDGAMGDDNGELLVGLGSELDVELIVAGVVLDKVVTDCCGVDKAVVGKSFCESPNNWL